MTRVLLLFTVAVAAFSQTFDWTKQVKNKPVYDVKQYGAKGDGSTNDTAAIQAAITAAAGSHGGVVLIPNGTYMIYDHLQIPTTTPSVENSRVTIMGMGMHNSRLRVDSTFNLARTGVFVGASCDGCIGPAFQDFTLDFEQPDSASLAAYTQYPPAFMMNGLFETSLKNLQISRAWKLGSFKGTYSGSWTVRVGQILIENVRASMFNIGFDIDGSLDTVRITGLHVWPYYSMTANQVTAFYANTQPAIKAGRIDNLMISDSLFINKRAVSLIAGADGGSTFGQINNSAFDSFANISVTTGNLQIGNSYSTLASTCDAPSISYTGGKLMITNHWFYADQCNQKFVDVETTTSAASSFFSMVGGTMERSDASSATLTPNDVMIQYASGIGVPAIVSGVYIYRDPTKTWSNPFIYCVGLSNACTITGVRAVAKSTGSGFLLSVDTDNYHQIYGNVAYGWSTSFPVTKTNGRYDDGSAQFNIRLSAPSSCASQPSGTLWTDVGTIKVCP